MKIDNYARIAFYIVMSTLGCLGTNLLDDLTDSVKILNERVAIVIERTNWHGKEIDRHEVWLNRLEAKNKRR